MTRRRQATPQLVSDVRGCAVIVGVFLGLLAAVVTAWVFLVLLFLSGGKTLS